MSHDDYLELAYLPFVPLGPVAPDGQRSCTNVPHRPVGACTPQPLAKPTAQVGSNPQHVMLQ
jgi:hypothetical protein